MTTPSKYVSLSIWRDEEAVRAWKDNAEYQVAQARGKGDIFAAYHIRVAEILRDYTTDTREPKRAEAGARGDMARGPRTLNARNGHRFIAIPGRVHYYAYIRIAFDS